MNKSGIYAIINPYNEKYYVGQSINLKHRWETHVKDLKYNKHFNDKLQECYNKYWISPFIFVVIEFCNKEFLNKREQYWIHKLTPHYNNRRYYTKRKRNYLTWSEMKENGYLNMMWKSRRKSNRKDDEDYGY